MKNKRVMVVGREGDLTWYRAVVGTEKPIGGRRVNENLPKE